MKNSRDGGTRSAVALLRFAHDDDAAAIRDVYAPAVLESAISFETELPGVDEMRARLHEVTALAPWLVLEDAGELLAYAYATRFRTRAAYRWAMETTVYVRAGHHRRGLGRAIYAPLLDLLRAQGFRQAIGAITLPNPGSVGLHERLGFRRCGAYPAVGWKFGAWHDVGLWELALAPAAPDPAEPRPLPAVRDTAPFTGLAAGRPVTISRRSP